VGAVVPIIVVHVPIPLDCLGAAPHYGTIGYVHGAGLDEPLAILDSHFSTLRVPHTNWRGLGESSSWPDGTPADCSIMSAPCTMIQWPAGAGVYMRVVPQPGPVPNWVGSLASNGQDGTGQLYRRNRYYDPLTGRFTQEDPIGLAGGVNLYGFAGGDPVTFTDPFGLCPPKDNVPCRDVNSEEGRKILHSAAKTGQWTWTEGKTDEGQIAKDVPNHVGDCADFCETGQENSGLPALDPRPSTGEFAGSSDFRPLAAGEKPQMGDVVEYHGHAGLSTGQVDKQGRPRALQNGKHGTRVIPFDKDAKIYRRQVPDSP